MNLARTIWACAVILPAVGLATTGSEDATVTRPPPPSTAAARTPPVASARLPSLSMDRVDLRGEPARDALRWWSAKTNIPLLVRWTVLENEGIDPQRPITLNLRRIPAGTALQLIVQQLAGPTRTIIEPTPWYVEVTTKAHADRNPVVRVYDIADLLHEVPNFDNAPRFDLTEALSNTNSGGGGRSGNDGRSGGSGGSSGSSGGIFTDSDRENERRERSSRAERAERIAQLLRDTIEPDIWQAHGGDLCSIRYFDGRLIVNAPPYVHRRIGVPVPRGRRRSPGSTAAPGSRTIGPRPAAVPGRNARTVSRDTRTARRISGISPRSVTRTSGISRR